MEALVIFIVIFGIVAVSLTASGIAVLNGKTDIIHEYHCKNVSDLKNYGKAMGKALIGMGAGSAIAVAVAAIWRTSIAIIIASVIFAVTMLAAFMVVEAIEKKYNGGMYS